VPTVRGRGASTQEKSGGPSALQEADDEHHYRDDQEQMNEPACDVEGEVAAEPENDKDDDENGQQVHWVSYSGGSGGFSLGSNGPRSLPQLGELGLEMLEKLRGAPGQTEQRAANRRKASLMPAGYAVEWPVAHATAMRQGWGTSWDNRIGAPVQVDGEPKDQLPAEARLPPASRTTRLAGSAAHSRRGGSARPAARPPGRTPPGGSSTGSSQ